MQWRMQKSLIAHSRTERIDILPSFLNCLTCEIKGVISSLNICSLLHKPGWWVGIFVCSPKHLTYPRTKSRPLIFLPGKRHTRRKQKLGKKPHLFSQQFAINKLVGSPWLLLMLSFGIQGLSESKNEEKNYRNLLTILVNNSCWWVQMFWFAPQREIKVYSIASLLHLRWSEFCFPLVSQCHEDDLCAALLWLYLLEGQNLFSEDLYLLAKLTF